MVDVDRSVIARIKKYGHTFEVLVDCDSALEMKQGKIVSLGDVLATNDIFKDVKKGEKANESDMKEAFGTDDVSKIAEKIIKEGEVQLTTKHREAERETKLKQIINLVHRNAVDSKTGHPHPANRIETAISQSKFRMDDFKSAEDQVEDALACLREIIPIKFERREIEIKIPAQFGGAASGVVHKHKVLKEEWLNDGSFYAVVEIPSGIMDEFFDELNKISHGQVVSKILKTIE
tara:strand:+ start:3339 stop:4040 length:702 start_codon:yes stop_codon:yes gene_type:complete